MKRPFVKLSLVAMLVCGLALGWRPPAAQAAFTANNLIDDNVFDNVNSLTAAQIDAWLNSTFPNSCISTNHGFSAPDPTGYSPGTGFTYGGAVSAGQVLYDAAQAYSINPRVLLATLQKEEGLVRGDGPYGCTTIAYTSAVGYGCPDSGSSYNYTNLNPPLYYLNGTAVTSVSNTCVNSASKAGFSQQLIRAAWLLKFGEQRSKGNTSWAVIKPGWDNSDDPPTCYSGPMTQGNRKRCSSDQNAVFYDGYTTIDGASTHMDTGATAALYWYTPHFHGNQTFVSIYEAWFGPTKGSLVKTANDSSVYLLNGTTANPIHDNNVLNDFAAMGPVRVTDASEINNYSTGPVLGHVVRNSGGTIYYVNASIKLPFPNCNLLADYGSACDLDQIPLIDDGLLNKLVNGPAMTSLMRSVSNSTIYYVNSGTKRPIPSWNDYQAFRTVVNFFTDSLVNQLPTSSFPAYGPGSLVKTANSGTVYIVKDINNLMPISNFIYPQEFGLSLNVRTIASAYTVLNSVENKIQCGGTKFLSTGGGSYSVSDSMMPNYSFNSNQFTDIGGVCGSLYFTPQALDQFIRVKNGTIYYVSGGQKQPIAGYSVYQAHGGTSANTVPVSDFFAGSLPTGATLTQ